MITPMPSSSERQIHSVAADDAFDAPDDKNNDMGFDIDEDFSAYDDVASRRLREKLTRDANVVTSEMVEDVMELLRAVGLPFLMAPSEAEAQCAALERLGLVDGVVTEDSDSFLFGAKKIYKNLFQDNKFVEVRWSSLIRAIIPLSPHPSQVYDIEDIERELSVDRDCLIAMAHLLGSDYVDGIRGVGIVNASEIVQTFMPRPDPGPERILRQRSGPDETLVDSSLFAQAVQSSADSISSGLGIFREWLDDDSPDSVRVQNILEKLKSRDALGDDIAEREESIVWMNEFSTQTFICTHGTCLFLLPLSATSTTDIVAIGLVGACPKRSRIAS
jgi:5'-3' exonuclease